MEQLVLPGMSKYMKKVKQAKKNRARGKAHQKKVAEKVNGLNLGTLGGTDVLSDLFLIEAKSREKFVGTGWYEQAEKHKKQFPSKMPLVVIHINKKSYDSDMVMLKLTDFLGLIQ